MRIGCSIDSRGFWGSKRDTKRPAGSSVRPDRAAARRSFLFAALVLAPLAPLSAQRHEFNVPAGQLGGALIAYGEQAGLSVGLTDPGLAARRSPGARGQLSSREALRRILKGTGATFIQIDPLSIRIIRATPATDPRARRMVQPPPRLPTAKATPPEIVVTASKQGLPLGQYAGSVVVLDFCADPLGRETGQGSAAIVARLPVLSSTHLGPGRNKLFVRGIADSSFNGATPATAGQYLGDVRLTYNAPDPNLNLYDLSGVEVLEGPQGTLYGTGALGGIIRLLPNAPDLEANRASAALGDSTVAHGGLGYDAAGMANLVIVPAKAALRAVAYATLDPGYIDDPSRGRTHVNRTKSRGGRATLLLRPAAGWEVTVGGAGQSIATRDGQYVFRRSPGLIRETRLSQPFDNDFGLAYATVKGEIRGAQFTSTSSIVRHDIDNSFDATVDGGAPRLFREDLKNRLLSHETHLSGQAAHADWLVGFSGLVASNRTVRLLGEPEHPEPIAGVRNFNYEAALFGQFARRLGSQWTLTAGARLSYDQGRGELLAEGAGQTDEPRRTAVRVSPTLALSWEPRRDVLAFVHAQSGVRPGVFEIGPDGTPDKASRIEPDRLSMIEAGVRYGQSRRDPLTISASVAAARWIDIQSDQVSSDGLPFTANIGDGRITTFELDVGWRLSPAFRLDGALFLNKSTLSDPAPIVVGADNDELPNIPHLVARVGATYRAKLDHRTDLTMSGSMRYTGKSSLGIGIPLDVAQGNYLETSLGGRLSRDKVGVSIDVSNVADSRGNRFSYGNPFGLYQRNQVTPLVPRSVRIGVDTEF